MAEAKLTIKVDPTKVRVVRLLLWELTELHARMRVEANPRADDLGAALERFRRPRREHT